MKFKIFFSKILSSFFFSQVGDINVQTLIGYTSFNDESGENPDRLVAIKRWLWSIVEKMSPLEKQDLVFFWTGSPALPGLFTFSLLFVYIVGFGGAKNSYSAS